MVLLLEKRLISQIFPIVYSSFDFRPYPAPKRFVPTSSIRPHVLHALQKHADYHGGKVTPDGQNPGAHVLWLK
jgi:hypothetical protein